MSSTILPFPTLCGRKILMDRQIYEINSVFSHHIGNVYAVKLTYLDSESKIQEEWQMANVLSTKIDQGAAKLLTESESKKIKETEVQAELSRQAQAGEG